MLPLLQGDAGTAARAGTGFSNAPEGPDAGAMTHDGAAQVMAAISSMPATAARGRSRRRNQSREEQWQASTDVVRQRWLLSDCCSVATRRSRQGSRPAWRWCQ